MRRTAPELIPVRMINEFVFCPRLFYLEFVQGEWADNVFTEDGKAVHRRVNRPSGEPADPDEDRSFVARSVGLSAPKLGISTKVDLLEGDGMTVTPVEYKRGKPAPLPGKVWDPERIQVCAQALALRENGYNVEKGIVFFKEARERVEVPIDGELEERTLAAIEGARRCAAEGVIPPPLESSPKCAGCSLNAICLPDEVHHLRGGTADVRLLHPARDDALPVYVQEQGGRIGVSNQILQVKNSSGAKIHEIRLSEISQLNILGNVGITTPAIRELANQGVPVSFFSFGGWYYGRLEGNGHKNVELRQAQYRSADLPGVALNLGKRFVSAKIANSRTLLRRNHPDAPRDVLDGLEQMRNASEEAGSIDELLGYEGNAARLYFSAFNGMLRPPSGSDPAMQMTFEGRRRRPPTDPINALLSFTYAMLTKDWTVTLSSIGLDPFLGFLHQPRYGRPSLALDLMEEFRPLVADSVVLQVVNGGIIGADDFIRSSLGVAIKAPARKKLIQAYERRMDQLVTHPVFDYRISYRRVLEVQARLLGRFLIGEIPQYPSFLTR